jgi:hypothetical protein
MLNPGRARLPLHWRITAAAADVMLDEGEPWMALMTVLAFHAFLRPGVAAGVRLSQLTPPVRRLRTTIRTAVGP